MPLKLSLFLFAFGMVLNFPAWSGCPEHLDLANLNQNHPKFDELGYVDQRTGRANLCGPTSLTNGMSRVLNRALSDSECIDFVHKIVQGGVRSQISLQDIVTRGFWPFELEQAFRSFLGTENVRADVGSAGAHSFNNNWDSAVFAANRAKISLPDIPEFVRIASHKNSLVAVNFLGFSDEAFAMQKFDPKKAVEDFQAGRIFLAHYLTVDRVLEVNEHSLKVSAFDPMNGHVELELTPFTHPIFAERIYKMKFINPASDKTFLVSAILWATRK